MSDSTENKRAVGGRSAAYPFIALDKALSRAEALRKAVGRNETRVASAMHHWGYGPKSSGGIQTVAALKHFGLIEDLGSGQDRRVKLSQLALRILLDQRPDSSERRELIKQAALTPKMHQELWGRWGAELPVDAEIRHYLILDRNFNENGADDLIAEFKATIAFAGLSSSDSIPSDASDISPDNNGAVGGQMETVRSNIREKAAGPFVATTQEVGDIKVVQTGDRLQIAATVDAEGIERLKTILDKYGEILKLLQ